MARRGGEVASAARDAFVQGMHVASGLSAVLVCVAAIAVLSLRRRDAREPVAVDQPGCVSAPKRSGRKVRLPLPITVPGETSDDRDVEIDAVASERRPRSTLVALTRRWRGRAGFRVSRRRAMSLSGAGGQDGVVEPRKRVVLALMCGTVFMTVVDLAVVNVALPTIQARLRLSAADLQWIVVACGLTVGGFLVIGGRAGDLFGHRRALVAGLGLLTAASLGAGLSGSLLVLVAARGLQGLGAAAAALNALAILTGAFAEGPERNRALGIFGAAGGVGAIAGSVLGGALVEGPGWRWIFFLNVPVGAALVVLIRARVSPTPLATTPYVCISAGR